MKTRFTNVLLVLTALLFSGSAMNAQTAFWSEDFDGGIPAGWTSVDQLGLAVWTYCATPSDNGINECPKWWDDGLNAQVPFASTSGTNGFMTVDSDANGYNDHISELTTSAIDLNGESDVILRFETHIGVYTVDAETGAIVRVSNDGGTTWTSYTVFPGLVTGGAGNNGVERWSLNPHISEIDISAVAGNQSAVLIQWQWTGNYEYHWSVDDVKLQDMLTPLPDNDMVSVDMNPPLYYATPVSQVNQPNIVDFGGIVANSGALDQTNVTLTATVVDQATSMAVTTDQLSEATLAAGDTILLDPIVDWTPPANVGAYTLEYVVSADAADDVPVNNDFSTPFIVTQGTFAKAEAATLTVSAGEPMEYGNFYTVVDGAGKVAESITTGFTNANNIDNQTITIYLMKVLVDVFDVNFDPNSFDDSMIDIVGTGFYTAPANGETNSGEITIDLVDDADFTSPVMLEDNTTYLAMYSDTDAAGDNRCYASSTIRYPFGFPSVVRTGGAIGGGAGQWFLGGFGVNNIAFVNLNITPEVAIFEPVPELTDDQVSVFPNPASELVTVDVELTDISETVEVKIIDAAGKVVRIEKYDDLKEGTFTYNVAQYAAGIYFMNIITDEGNKTNRFTVAR